MTTGAVAVAEPPSDGRPDRLTSAGPAVAAVPWLHRARRAAFGRSTLSLVARGSVLAVLVAGVTTWAVFDRTVTLDVDGATRTVRFFGTGVDDAVAAAQVTVGERDRVSPARGASIADGGRLTVRYARPFTVTTDGVPVTYWTTERTVDGAVAAIGLRLAGARLSVSRDEPIGRQGLTLAVTLPKTLTLTVSGAARELTTTAATVTDALAEAGVVVAADDRLTPDGATPVTDGMAVTLAVVDTSQAQETVAIDPPVRQVDDATLLVGQTRVRQPGKPGQAQVTYSVTTVDGVAQPRTEVARTVVSAPVEKVVAVGTKQPAPAAPAAAAPATPAPAGAGGSLNWAALAKCESGGNPSIVSSNGLYYGLYQFDIQTWRAMGGSGTPAQASAAEQTQRAQALYAQRGASPWPGCGARLFT